MRSRGRRHFRLLARVCLGIGAIGLFALPLPVNAGASSERHVLRMVHRPAPPVDPIDGVVDLVAAPGFPAVETVLMQPGQPGQVLRLFRRHSGQAAGEEVLQPATPPTPQSAPLAVLTFDDGPDPRWTPQVLDILKSRDVKAVFCVVGFQIARYPSYVARVASEGHALCDHTENHDMHMSGKDPAYVAAMIRHPYDMIRDITGAPPRFYRGPGGNLSPFIIDEAHRLGMRVLGWSVDPADYHTPGAQMIQNRVVAQMRPGVVVLMHDGGGDRSQTVQQLAGLIDRLRAAGYSFALP